MTHRCKPLKSLVLATVLAAAAGAAQAAVDYRFTPLALSGTDFDPFGFGAPVLNNAGLAAFGAVLADGSNALLASSGTPTTVADETLFRRFGNPTINGAGQIGFEASLRNVTGEGIFRGPGTPPVTVAGTRDAGDFDFVNAGPSMNAAGRVAFIGERIVAGQFVAGVYAGSGGAVAPIVDASNGFSGFTGNPSLNDPGQVAFVALRDNAPNGLFLGSGGAFTTVADESGRLTSVFGFGDPSLNERGEVAFRAGTNDDPDENGGSTGEGIFLFTGGRLTTVVEGGFATFAALGDPSLNNLGQVAFVASPTFSEQVLVVGASLTDGRVIGTGDLLFGRRVSGVVFSREGLNDQGQLAFAVLFDDGSSGVFLATPVPEPATWLLLLAGAGVALPRIARRGRGRGARAGTDARVGGHAVGGRLDGCVGGRLQAGDPDGPPRQRPGPGESTVRQSRQPAHRRTTPACPVGPQPFRRPNRPAAPFAPYPAIEPAA